ncbi:ABC transporter substrate-binding protein [Bradyrhizobium sp. AUGA SZCCT0431]|uniref:ABC transporter substrate-binding protein n=1 Tax=Bradyrhizobium sp. AUGA SZCCT0431 TaxID=2807674 RepID=UPI002012F056|nr:ABC transporter substrate-binding protein [Bradyrhizobium sp. AUGA SZCCT0431]
MAANSVCPAGYGQDRAHRLPGGCICRRRPRGGEALENGLRELGHVPGRSVLIEYRWASGKLEQLDVLAGELVRLPVDVLVAPTTSAALAAKRVTSTVPIVFATVATPVELGLVNSLARPGGNVTGLSYYISPEIVGKQLQLLQSISPRISRVAILWVPGNAGLPPMLEEATRAAEQLGLQLRLIETQEPADFEAAFRSMVEQRADALLVLPDARLSEHRIALGMLALENRLPAMFGSREDMAAGSLIAYGPGRLDLVRRSAGYVDKILKGARPADLPVEQPTKFELLINLKTAKQLGITVPSALLAQADEVVE